ncbi:MAG: cytochrome d ubiquinol oxidase subunit II [Deltaproteobacteria bacterium]|nr:cytochrome d ubiquinol oxidase subunit II [Deltaproteobacteria bacterium]
MLETLWFFLWGLLWAVYFMLDGFDLGLGILLPVTSKRDKETRALYRAMGPFWDGNEVWLVAAGGVTFAAFPTAYAVMFSSLYAPLLCVLFALIIRAVAVEFRGQLEASAWRAFWDACLWASSFAAAFLFGLIFANLFRGIPLNEDGLFQGSLLALFNLYGVSGGAFFLIAFMFHGSLWLVIKSDGKLRSRAIVAAVSSWTAVTLAALLFLILSGFRTDLYVNYVNMPVLFLIPGAAIAALLAARIFISRRSWWKAWFSSAIFIVAATFFGIAGLYPYILRSTLDERFGITLYEAASSPLTLKTMLVVVCIFVPLVLVYQGWVYWLFRDRIEDGDTAAGEPY